MPGGDCFFNLTGHWDYNFFTPKALKYFWMETRGLFLIWNHHNVLVICFTWILICFGSTVIKNKYVYSFSAVIDFRRQNLTSADVRFWRLKSIPRTERVSTRCCPYVGSTVVQHRANTANVSCLMGDCNIPELSLLCRLLAYVSWVLYLLIFCALSE